MSQPPLIHTPDSILATAGRRGRRAPRPPHPYADRASKHDRGVRALWCRNCGAPILLGDDADLCAFRVRVDAQPLTALGEMLAQLDGRRTYELRHDPNTPAQLVRRTAWLISTRPAGENPRPAFPCDVLAAHVCTPTPDVLTTGSHLRPTSRTTTTDHNTPPPF